MAVRSGFMSAVLDWFAPQRLRTRAYEPRWRDEPGWDRLGDRRDVLPNLIALSEKHYATDGYYRNGCDAWTTALAGAGWGFAPREGNLLDLWSGYAGSAVWGGGSFDSLTGALARDMVVSGKGVAILQPDWTWLRILRSAIAHDHDNGTTIREGVEFTDGRESAIWIRRDPAASPERIDRARYVRLWREDFPGQVRGAPWGAAVLTAADTLADTENALVMGVKVAAMFAGIATDENNGGADFPFDGTSRGSVLESGLEPGTLKVLPAGWRVQFATPQQAQQSAEFLRHQLHRISAGFGVPTHLVSNNLADANYGSLRAGWWSSPRAWRRLSSPPSSRSSSSPHGRRSSPASTWRAASPILRRRCRASSSRPPAHGLILRRTPPRLPRCCGWGLPPAAVPLPN